MASKQEETRQTTWKVLKIACVIAIPPADSMTHGVHERQNKCACSFLGSSPRLGNSHDFLIAVHDNWKL